MTHGNALHLTGEYQCVRVCSILPNFSSINQKSSWKRPFVTMKTLLLLGGMTPDVTTLYYRTINNITRTRLAAVRLLGRVRTTGAICISR